MMRVLPFIFLLLACTTPAEPCPPDAFCLSCTGEDAQRCIDAVERYNDA
jgi:hypothetical protein